MVYCKVCYKDYKYVEFFFVGEIFFEKKDVDIFFINKNNDNWIKGKEDLNVLWWWGKELLLDVLMGIFWGL